MSAAAPRPATTLRVSEVFLSLQGEGPSAGTPAHFVRLQGCDVGCTWCDTKYAWDAAGGRGVELAALWDEAHALGRAPLVVITGGEPLQHPEFAAVLELALERWPRVEVETSGILPPPCSHERLAWNVSPKLPAAGGRWQETWRHAAAWVAEPRAMFKLVMADDADLAEARARMATAGIPRGRAMYMPQGLTDADIARRAAWLAPACIADGVRLSPRLHVWLWGARRGV
ncbi:MAG TPA: 7-carboxy-7-deazaguanine synthase QueE [Candidatus Eisenbacteria bacterium]|nr:7-carboxy-7-deazaguanine synthase QueE [Candidatus Eisenbacteria bacterium]